MRARTLAIALLTLMLSLLPSAASAELAADSDVIADQFIVVLKPGFNPSAEAVAAAQSHGVGILHVYEEVLNGYAFKGTAQAAQALARHPGVRFISQDRVMRATAQTLPTGVDRIQADLSSTHAGDGSGSVNVAVAVIDTGANFTHPDLNVAGGVDCTSRNNPEDGNGHGSHVSGTIGARDNGIGVVGVAPGVKIYVAKVLNRFGIGSTSNIICGINAVTQAAPIVNIKVANMSLGGAGADDGNCGLTNGDAQHKAICDSVAKGVTYVVAAGNDGRDFATSTPAAYNEVLTVTAMADYNGQEGGGAAATCRAGTDDAAADFSNFTQIGSSDVQHTIAAPGVCIASTWQSGAYRVLSGTSMASPHVAGAVALCVGSGACAGLSPSQIIAKLRADASARPASYGFTGDPNSPMGTRYYGPLVYTGGY